MIDLETLTDKELIDLYNDYVDRYNRRVKSGNIQYVVNTLMILIERNSIQIEILERKIDNQT